MVEESEAFNQSSISLSDLSEDYDVHKFIHDFDEHSLLEKLEGREIPEYHAREIEIGGVLQRGTFASVYKVTIRALPEEKVQLKRIDSVLQQKADVYQECALNMANEVKILSCVHHDNIIQLKGIHAGDMTDLFESKQFFIILEAITSTLENKLDQWLQEESGKMFQSKKTVTLARIREVAIGIASAMVYLHSKNIIFRDIRPRSIGFNSAGVVRLTNFSRARDLDVVKGIGEQLQYCGIAPYVAPEVIQGKWYDEKADVFSFGILMWEILTLQKPFHTLMHADQLSDAVMQGKRPQLSTVSSKSMKKLIKDCWGEDPDLRPTFVSIHAQLETYLESGDSTREPHQGLAPPASPPRIRSPFARKKSSVVANSKKGLFGSLTRNKSR